MNFVIAIVGIILIAIGAVLFFTDRLKGKKVIPFVLVGVLIIIFAFSFKIIPTGYTGVKTKFKQVDPNPVPQGFNWKIPFVQSIEIVNNKQQDIKIDGQIWSETESRTALYYEGITVTYQINPEKSAWIYANVSDYTKALISNAVVSSAVKESSKSLSDTDATNRGIIEPLVMKNLQEGLDEKYKGSVVFINKVTIDSADFESSYNDAISAKQQAQLESEKQSIENQKNIDKAEADAKVRITNAQAAADAQRIEAQGQADANDLLENSLSNEILRKLYLEKWNGELPKVVSGENSDYILSVDDVTE